jgi:hypothetical protein
MRCQNKTRFEYYTIKGEMLLCSLCMVLRHQLMDVKIKPMERREEHQCECEHE